MKKLIGYVYHNGFWYRQYKTFREVCSETEIVDKAKMKEEQIRKYDEEYSDLLVFDDQPQRQLENPDCHNEV